MITRSSNLIGLQHERHPEPVIVDAPWPPNSSNSLGTLAHRADASRLTPQALPVPPNTQATQFLVHHPPHL